MQLVSFFDDSLSQPRSFHGNVSRNITDVKCADGCEFNRYFFLP